MTVKFTEYVLKFDRYRTITENIESKTKITKVRAIFAVFSELLKV